MAWLVLLCAGLLEIVWAIGLKYCADALTYTEGSSKFVPSVIVPSIITAVAMIGSLILLAQAMKNLPVGTAYAVWTGIGAVGASIVGIILFKEPIGAIRILSLCLIVVGLLGLKLSAAS